MVGRSARAPVRDGFVKRISSIKALRERLKAFGEVVVDELA